MNYKQGSYQFRLNFKSPRFFKKGSLCTSRYAGMQHYVSKIEKKLILERF